MKKKLLVLLVVPVLLLVAAVAIAGFNMWTGSGSDNSSDGASSAAEMNPAEVKRSETESKMQDVAGSSTGSVGKQAVVPEPMMRAVISTGQVTVHPASIKLARLDVMRLVTSWNGTIADEQTSSSNRGDIVESTMTLRVPTAKFSEAMAAFADLGKVEQQSRKSEDVTTQVIDNDARVRAAERSIRQIENLLSRAEKLGDVIAIESDLARRQADLDSLRSQQAYLTDQTSLSTIIVYLSRTGDLQRQDDARGFLAGLDDGWTAMKGATAVLLTVLGAVLPFALVLAVLGVPLWLLARRRLGARLSAGSAPARSA